MTMIGLQLESVIFFVMLDENRALCEKERAQLRR